MNKLKTFLGNLPIYLGLLLRKVSDTLIVLGLKLHVLLKTEAGKNLKKFQDEMMAKLKTMQAAQASTTQVGEVKAKQVDRYSKLSDLIKGSNNGSSNS